MSIPPQLYLNFFSEGSWIRSDPHADSSAISLMKTNRKWTKFMLRYDSSLLPFITLQWLSIALAKGPDKERQGFFIFWPLPILLASLPLPGTAFAPLCLCHCSLITVQGPWPLSVCCHCEVISGLLNTETFASHRIVILYLSIPCAKLRVNCLRPKVTSSLYPVSPTPWHEVSNHNVMFRWKHAHDFCG